MSNNKNSIFFSILLVIIAMLMCGKDIHFLLYTLLGRIILVLSIIGLTMVKRSLGLLGIFFIVIMWGFMDYREGFACVNPASGESEEQDVTEASQCSFPDTTTWKASDSKKTAVTNTTNISNKAPTTLLMENIGGLAGGNDSSQSTSSVYPDTNGNSMNESDNEESI